MKTREWIVLLSLIVAGIVLYSNFSKSNECANNLQPNTEPQFTIGQTFSYRTNNLTMADGVYYEKSDFIVNGTKVINGDLYYEIVRYWTAHILSDCVSCPSGKSHSMNNRTQILYFHCETGSCIGKNIDAVKFSNEDFYATDIGFFAYWMLGLKENICWTMNEDSLIQYNFEVIGKEEILGKESFKVKMQHMSKGELEEVRHYWVDSERRILVEAEINRGTRGGKLYIVLVDPKH